MFNTVEEMMNYLHTRESALGMDFGLGRMESILTALGNPERKFRSIHIAGTNGKGSTLNVIKQILIQSGLQTGTFTSPHLERVNERIMINNTQISDKDLLELINHAFPVIEEYGATYFEILTILSFMYFEKRKVDIAVIETGLGGRLDSTNVITPLLSVITSIGLDHTNILGNTLAEIAFEKAGIIKQAVPVISGVRVQEPSSVIAAKAAEQSAQLYMLDHDLMISNYQMQNQTQSFSLTFGDVEFVDLIQPMFGRHQVDNAALGVSAILLLNQQYGYQIDEECIRKGLLASKWNGRFERLSPQVIIDGAHNPAGITVLIKTLKERYPDKNYRFVFTALQDKKFDDMLHLIDEHASALILTQIDIDRASSLDDLLRASKLADKIAFTDWKEAAEYGLNTVKENEILIFTGSLYFVAFVRPYLKRKIIF